MPKRYRATVELERSTLLRDNLNSQARKVVEHVERVGTARVIV